MLVGHPRLSCPAQRRQAAAVAAAVRRRAAQRKECCYLRVVTSHANSAPLLAPSGPLLDWLSRAWVLLGSAIQQSTTGLSISNPISCRQRQLPRLAVRFPLGSSEQQPCPGSCSPTWWRFCYR